MFLLVKPLPYISLHKFLYWNFSLSYSVPQSLPLQLNFLLPFLHFHSETGRSKVLSCLWVIIWWIWVRSKWSKYPLSSILEIWVILGFSLFFTLHLARSSLADYLFNLSYTYILLSKCFFACLFLPELIKQLCDQSSLLCHIWSALPLLFNPPQITLIFNNIM